MYHAQLGERNFVMFFARFADLLASFSLNIKNFVGKHM